MTVLVAAAQLRAFPLSDPAAALVAIHRAIDRAVERGAELLVLPECAYPAYCLGSVAAYRAAQVIPNDAFMADLAERAREHRLHIVCGFVEDRGSSLANAAVLIDDHGERVGIYRKTFLWGDDNDVFAPGEETRPFETRFGKIGIIICADARAPETVAAHAAQGAELICVPTCWVNVAVAPGQYYNPQPDFLIPARAREFGLPFVCANKFGRETQAIDYCGQSLIVDQAGNKLAEAPSNADALLLSDVALQPARPARLDPHVAKLLAREGPPPFRTVSGGEIHVAVVPGCLMAADPETENGRALLRWLSECEVGLMLAGLPAGADVRRWAEAAEDHDISLVSGDASTAVREDWFGPYAVVSSAGLSGYAVARLRALEGAAILFAADAPDDLATWRARAAENRVFVIAASANSAAIISPGGAVLAACDPRHPRVITAMIDPQQAADKTVFPKTHIWEQRRPSACRAAFDL